MAHPKKSLEEKIVLWLEITGLCLAGVWASFNFGWENFLKADTTPANVSFTLEAKQLENKIGLVNFNSQKYAVPVQIHSVVKNISGKRIYIIGSVYNITGVRLRQSPNTEETAFLTRSAQGLDNTDLFDSTTYSRFFDNQDTDLLYAGHLLTEDDVLEPGETNEKNFIVYLRPGQNDYIEIFGEVNICEKKTDLKVDYRATSTGLARYYAKKDNPAAPIPSVVNQASDGYEHLNDGEKVTYKCVSTDLVLMDQK
jgi:nitrogen fixation protein